MCDRYIAWLPLTGPQSGTWPATQACAMTGNRTSDPLVHRLVFNLLNHTNQDSYYVFEDISYRVFFFLYCCYFLWFFPLLAYLVFPFTREWFFKHLVSLDCLLYLRGRHQNAPYVQVYGLVSSSRIIRQDPGGQVRTHNCQYHRISPLGLVNYRPPHPHGQPYIALPTSTPAQAHMLPCSHAATLHSPPKVSRYRSLCGYFAGMHLLTPQLLLGANSYFPDKGLLESLLLFPYSSPCAPLQDRLSLFLLSSSWFPMDLVRHPTSQYHDFLLVCLPN